jgi:hypothetical protein
MTLFRLLTMNRRCIVLIGLLACAPVITSVAAEAPDSVYVLPEGESLLAPPQGYVDLDSPYGPPSRRLSGPGEPWEWQLLPQGLIYRSYLAGTKEPRFSTQIVNEQHSGWLFDATEGARVALLRFGTRDPIWPSGFEIDAEGAAQLRLDLAEEVDFQGVDFRGGVPLTFGVGPLRTKFAYYHLSSHAGDEFLLKHPAFQRLNYSRDVLVLGHSVNLTGWLRVYAEAGWAFYSDVGEPWEFQFGVDYEAPGPTGCRGAPFFAINGHFRQEVNFGGGMTVQTGWSWRSNSGSLLRAGLHYYNGESNQFEFYDEHEQQIGFGVWYDF